ncbi:hypothetical protein B0J15DRAFT_592680 [Fusarium solani]|uniref:Uncharacterized protein n=1 Tax=Fusarium solani TaxID=169388 RepID=A0A9P9KNY3_FUSSL|nr:uncharacterized protein B0J15DRAFT_592680 [Fusarium solani]KAH7266250.1 hypothetical protein B0J15DRAFT_592680 [Fusarium solani]
MRFELALLALAQGVLATPCKGKKAVDGNTDSTAFLTPAAAPTTSTTTTATTSSTSSTPVVITFTNAAGSTIVTTLSPPSTSTTTTTTTTTTTSNQAAGTGAAGGSGGRRLTQRNVNNDDKVFVLRQTVDRQFRVPDTKSNTKSKTGSTSTSKSGTSGSRDGRIDRIESIPNGSSTTDGGSKVRKIKYPSYNEPIRGIIIGGHADDDRIYGIRRVSVPAPEPSEEEYEEYENKLYDNVSHEVASGLGLSRHRTPKYKHKGHPIYKKLGLTSGPDGRIRYKNYKRSSGKKPTLVDQAKISKEQRERLRELYLKYREILAGDIVDDLDKVFKVTAEKKRP